MINLIAIRRFCLKALCLLLGHQKSALSWRWDTVDTYHCGRCGEPHSVPGNGPAWYMPSIEEINAEPRLNKMSVTERDADARRRMGLLR